jgi:hypothetical protein
MFANGRHDQIGAADLFARASAPPPPEGTERIGRVGAPPPPTSIHAG